MKTVAKKKFIYTAIRALPEEWVDDETSIATIGANFAIAVNPKYAPMEFSNSGKWQEVHVSPGAALIISDQEKILP